MKYLILLALSTLLLADKDMLGLLHDLNNASEISTKTKLNVNKTPAVVSVLHADELRKLGFTNLYEALESVPGIEISMGVAGAKQINMRGNKSFVTDKLKFMVDGVGINAELSGANHFYLNMPLENIQRIEVIRGPASALYGSFAHIGLINIITKASTYKKGLVFVRGSSEGSKNIGFTQNVQSKNTKLAIYGSFGKNENSRVYENYSLLPGKYNSYEDFTEKSLGFNAQAYKDFSLLSKYHELNTQNYFGYGMWPIVQDPKTLKHSSWVNELRYTPKLSQTLSLDLKLGYKEYRMSGDSRVVPYSKIVPTSRDYIAGGIYKEKTLYSDLGGKYKYNNNIFTFGVHLGQTSVRNPIYQKNSNLNVFPIPSDEKTINVEGGGIINKIDRKHYALYLNDIITLSSKWMANVGVRYDDYSDVNSALSPKLSLLYMPDVKQSYKLMYQNSFRVPTFVETYGTQKPFKVDEKLDSETIDTLEFAYSYQRGYDSWLNLNFFYSQMQNFIYRDSSFILRNGLDATSYGAEFEFKIPLFSKSTLQANYSYVHSEDENHKQTPLIANHLANAMLSYQISKNWHTSSRVRYVGNKKREEGDSRESLEGYTTFDQTLTFTYDDFLIRASVKNLFDANIFYIAPMGNGITSGTYIDDLEQNGRTFWLSAEWKFE